jgi:predicted AAA+ superfamily ATPase
MYKRTYEPLETHLTPNKVLVIYGPRGVGKTTLLQKRESISNYNNKKLGTIFFYI